MLCTEVSEEVRETLAAHRPVAAAEATIVPQGPPRPPERAVAVEPEGRTRSRGSAPATVTAPGGRGLGETPALCRAAEL
ncbi:pseudouridine-5'-phosphate glycosidase [Streptomyces sp. NPDC001985]|uniref:pseudouridine-5'-phosphate glycosidase n=1 Tax=Streptomyces sp. NPDC001985 TaxID=3154406 RepID=UPI003322A8C5